jgi:hypothetical protein
MGCHFPELPGLYDTIALMKQTLMQYGATAFGGIKDGPPCSQLPPGSLKANSP